MTETAPTVTYKGREDGQPSSALTVRVAGEVEVLELERSKGVSRAIAQRCDELRDTYKFEVRGLGGSGSGSGSSSSARSSGGGGES